MRFALNSKTRGWAPIGLGGMRKPLTNSIIPCLLNPGTIVLVEIKSPLEIILSVIWGKHANVQQRTVLACLMGRSICPQPVSQLPNIVGVPPTLLISANCAYFAQIHRPDKSLHICGIIDQSSTPIHSAICTGDNGDKEGVRFRSPWHWPHYLGGRISKKTMETNKSQTE